MKVLVINAPKNTDRKGNRSFEDTLETQVGEEHLIYPNLHAQVEPGCRVIVLDKDQGKQAEGKLLKLDRGTVAGNGRQRYNVHMKQLEPMEYRGDEIWLNYCGVAVIDE
jgi:hypothetical protein